MSATPTFEQIRLQENFRSSPGVIDTARKFVETIDGRLDKAMSSGGSQRYQDGDIVALSFDNPAQEARYIVDTLRSLHGVTIRGSWRSAGVGMVRHGRAAAQRAEQRPGYCGGIAARQAFRSLWAG